MFPLGRQAMICGDNGPAIAQWSDIPPPGIDHGFDGENHAGFEAQAAAFFAVMEDLRFFVKVTPDAVTTKLADYAVPRFFGKGLNGMADVSQMVAWSDGPDAVPERFISQVAKTAGLFADFSHTEHAAGIPMKSFLDDGDVEIDDVSILEDAVAGNAVTDLMVDRSANRTGIGPMSLGRIIQGGRDGVLNLDHVVMAQAIQMVGGDARNHVGRNVVQHFGSEATGDTHFVNFFGVFQSDCRRRHEFGIWLG